MRKSVAFYIFAAVLFLKGEGLHSGVKYDQALFAGGCFWSLEEAFERLPGVMEAVSGYTGGHKVNPTYEEVCSGTTGHAEVVLVIYDPRKISYRRLLEVYWGHIDPTDAGGQYADRGGQYRTAIYYRDQDQRREAERFRNAMIKSGRYSNPVVTKILRAEKFYRAEAYYPDYYKRKAPACRLRP